MRGTSGWRMKRERELADEYARAYGEAPQEGWVGQAGLALAAALYLEEEEEETEPGQAVRSPHSVRRDSP